MSHQIRHPDGQIFGAYTSADIRAYLANGRIPQGSHIKTENGWVPVETWMTTPASPLAGSAGANLPRPKPEPTRTWLLALILVVVPPVWGFFHLIFLAWSGLGLIFLGWFPCLLAALLVLVLPIRTMGPLAMVRTLQRNPLALVPIVVVALVWIGSASFYGVTGRWQNQRINAAVSASQSDPCNIEQLSAADREADSWARSDVHELEEKCKAGRAEAAAKTEAEAQTAAESAACARLERSLGKSGLFDTSGLEPLNLSADQKGLLQRVHGRLLESRDLQTPLDALPCGDSSAVKMAFMRAVRESPKAWAQISTLPDSVRTELQREGLPAHTIAAFKKATERRALGAASERDTGTGTFVGAINQCGLAQSLGAYPEVACKQLHATRELLERQQEARARTCDRLRDAAIDCDNARNCALDSACERQCWAQHSARCN